MNTWVERRQIEQDALEEGKKLLDPSFFAAYLRDLDAFRARCKQFHRQMWLRQYEQAERGELVQSFQAVGEHLMLAFAYFKGSRPEYTKPAEAALQLELAARTDDATLAAAWSLVLTAPEELDEIKEEQLAWNVLVRTVRRGRVRDPAHALTEHLLNFSWLYPDELEVTVPLARLQRKLEKETRSDGELRDENQALRAKQSSGREQRQSLLAMLSSDRIRHLADVIALSGYKRMQIKDCWAGMHTICGTLWLEAARRLQLDPQQLFYYYLPADIEGALTEGMVLPAEEIARRDDYTLLYLREGTMTIEHGAAARDRGKQLLAETLEELNTGTLTGQVAFRGQVTGTARLVTLADFAALEAAAAVFHDGDIMVTQMTQPNMVPLARRASAIVTDEGGITSHAAIISREFKIPCIVGTKLATKVIRDGDFVEFDAERGMVTVRQRAKDVVHEVGAAAQARR
ncbi:MAG: hypothetical protein HY372_03165 [Candidatus Andersenbacteria bacterium]|nr:hypothetical protein [Candidatus Andersenbacteria bacterium]